MKKEQCFKLDDSVIARIVQMLQEAILTGVDITDLMRMMELTPNTDNKLILTESYLEIVEREHADLLEFARHRKAQLKLEKQGVQVEALPPLDKNQN